MKAMGKALQNRYDKGLKIEVIIKGNESDEQMKHGSDLAPEVKDAPPVSKPDEYGMEQMAAEMPEAPAGRPQTLDERAGAKMKEAMKAKKKA